MSRFTNTWMVAILVLVTIGALGACSGKNDQVAKEPALAVPAHDYELSYRNEPLGDDSGAPLALFDAPDPGESKVPERAFENAPPVIPHSVEDLLPITMGDNSCLDCHLPENAVDAEATALPASHFYDIRRDKALTELAGANYNCTLCHAPQASNATELVENIFAPDFRGEGSEHSSNLLDILDEGVK